MSASKVHVYRSIASALTQAAMHLTVSDDQNHRAVGAALLQAEPLSHYKHEDEEHIRYRGRLSIRLGFYSQDAMDIVKRHESIAADALTRATVGPMSPGLQLSVAMLSEQEWHVRQFKPAGSSDVHLHRLLSEQERQREPKRTIVLRRLRYRLGNDHNWEPEHSDDLIVWSTAKTRLWAQQISGDKNRPGRVASCVADRAGERGAATDWADLNPDDWGAVDLESDRISVQEVTTKSGVTKTEVGRILGAASTWLDIRPVRHTDTTQRASPVRVFATEIRRLADGPENVDVAICHRGGGLYPPGHEKENVSHEDRAELLEAVLSLRNKGVEVILGLGHGNLSVLPNGTDEVGIYEATTPTAAAAWLVSEHVSTLLVDRSLALGQE